MMRLKQRVNRWFDLRHVLIIAEAGVNHNGSLGLAYKLVDAAVASGADAVKFQTFKARDVVLKSAEKAGYQKRSTGADETQFEMIKKLELSFGDFIKLKKYCDEKGILFLSTPSDYKSVDFLERLVPAYKIGSGEITNLPFLEYIAKKRKPVILSTGASTLSEIRSALKVIQRHLKKEKIALLHCTTDYPAPYEEANLRALVTLQDAFGLSVGYSDHTLGTEASIAAVALGACIIEKHFTLNRKMKGPDHNSSLRPDELAAMIKAIRNTEKALGDGIKRPSDSEIRNRTAVRRSIVTSKYIRKGETLTAGNLAVKRPATGISPAQWYSIIGTKAKKNFQKDELIKT